jgi:hypothetical protein
MTYTDDHLINVVRDAVEGVLRHPQPIRCHLPSGHLDVDEFKAYFRRTAGIASSVRPESKHAAWHVELLDEPERERILEEALRIYRPPCLN